MKKIFFKLTVAVILMLGFAQASARNLTPEQTPADVSMVINSMQLTMRHLRLPTDKDLPQVIMSKATRAALQEPDFDYAGFSLVQVVLSKHNRAADGMQTSISGAFRFEDSLMRRSVVRFAAEYIATARGVLVKNAFIGPMYPENPRVAFYIVPASRISIDDVADAWNNALILDTAMNNGIRPGDVSKVPKGEQDYYLFGFFLDRVARNAAIELVLSDNKSGTDGILPDPLEVRAQGWRVVMSQVTLDLYRDRDLWAKLLYRAGPKISPKAVGVFSLDLLDK